MPRISCALRRVFALSALPTLALWGNIASAQISLPSVTGEPAVATAAPPLLTERARGPGATRGRRTQ